MKREKKLKKNSAEKLENIKIAKMKATANITLSIIRKCKKRKEKRRRRRGGVKESIGSLNV